MSERDLDVVCGAGGFIGGHLVGRLLDLGRRVRAVDVKPRERWHQLHDGATNDVLDLRQQRDCVAATEDAGRVFNLACDMGGMGFIETHRAQCMLSVLINTHLLLASRANGVERFFFSSSACVYSADKQLSLEGVPLREEDAYPALPEDGYGWEKLFSERMCRHFTEDFGLPTRVARFHNVYGPCGTWDGVRAKAPASICRKVIRAKLSGRREIEIWGTGEQSRSFTYVDDCVRGVEKIMGGDASRPVNLGSSETVTVNQLVDMVEAIAGVRLRRTYDPDAPRGVNGRSSDNTLIRELFGWEPSISLVAGLERTYRWIYDEIVAGRPGNP